jgi:hypothetical protein
LRIAIENSNINLNTDYVKTKLLQMDVEMDTALLAGGREKKV